MTKKIFSKPQAVIGLVLIVIVVICAIFAPVIAAKFTRSNRSIT